MARTLEWAHGLPVFTPGRDPFHQYQRLLAQSSKVSLFDLHNQHYSLHFHRHSSNFFSIRWFEAKAGKHFAVYPRLLLFLFMMQKGKKHWSCNDFHLLDEAIMPANLNVSILEKIKFQMYGGVEEVIHGLILLSKKVSSTYSKTAISSNLCWRFWRRRKALHFPFLTGREPPYLLQRPWLRRGCRQRTSLTSRLPFHLELGLLPEQEKQSCGHRMREDGFLFFLNCMLKNQEKEKGYRKVEPQSNLGWNRM